MKEADLVKDLGRRVLAWKNAGLIGIDPSAKGKTTFFIILTTVLAFIIWLMAWSTTEKTRDYFKEQGINLHLISGKVVESETEYLNEDPNLIGNQANKFAIYCVFGSLPFGKGGWYQSGEGIRISSSMRWIYTFEDKNFGHEIFHAIGVQENYGADPENNYMRDVPAPFLFPIPPLNWVVTMNEWEQVNLLYKGGMPYLYGASGHIVPAG